MDADVLVVGAGPAGAACALTLARYSALRVVVLDRHVNRPRGIGEMVGPGVLPLLAYLGLSRQFRGSHRRAHTMAAAWGSKHLVWRDTIFTGYGDNWHLDRPAFEHLLITALSEAGCDCRLGADVLTCSLGVDGLWNASYKSKHESAPSVLRARFFVDVRGRSALADRSPRAARTLLDKLVGVTAILTPARSEQRSTYTLVEAFRNGWWYSADLPCGRLAITLMADPDFVSASKANDKLIWSSLLSSSQFTYERAQAYAGIEHIKSSTAGSSYLNKVAGVRWIAAGDAAAAFDPLSSMGIGYALSSGIHAARVVVDEVLGGKVLQSQYLEQQRTNLANYRILRSALYGAERRWPDESFWRRRRNMRAISP